MKRIEFKYDGFFGTTECPNGCLTDVSFPVWVGSSKCQRCKWFKGIDFEARLVYCNYDEKGGKK